MVGVLKYCKWTLTSGSGLQSSSDVLFRLSLQMMVLSVAELVRQATSGDWFLMLHLLHG